MSDVFSAAFGQSKAIRAMGAAGFHFSDKDYCKKEIFNI
jgi:hypothetical protein